MAHTKNTENPLIGIIVGSASDLKVAAKAADVLKEFGVPFEVGVASAHRTPDDVMRYAAGAEARGIKAIVAMAGLSAALPGVMAAHTTLPVIGVPIASGPLNGQDALLAVAQMPPGVPVGSMGIDGAKNAALMALRILATGDAALRDALAAYAQKAADDVRKSREKVVEADLPPVPASAFGAGA
jgi:phosphoribosylaminoimidazole carboxylase, PurE protein